MQQIIVYYINNDKLNLEKAILDKI